ncbi:MAG: BrnA antitoxin family protein [Methylovulum sp.]|nr:BrnA antitoxin family protein [Methylovulum sp.]
MANPSPITDTNGEVRELTQVDFNNAVPFSSLPESLQTTLKGLKGRGIQKRPTKVSTTVRFDPDVLAAFRATGTGWQTRMNEALKEWLKIHAPEP